MKELLIGYFVLVNLIAFNMYGFDKRKAIKDDWRIPEVSLLMVSVIGGALGSFLGMRIFHHKTRKPLFQVVAILSLIMYTILLSWLYMKSRI